MEVIKIVGNDSSGLHQRVLVELGRRKINIEKSFMARSKGTITIILEANTGNMNGRLLHALMALHDVNSAEYINEDYFCFWESSPTKGSDFIIACGADKDAGEMKKTAEHCLYKSTDNSAKN
jgi:acetolactate synthase-1/2/3 large subunit